VLVVFHEELLGGASRAVLRLVPLLEQAGWVFSFWAPTLGPLNSALDAGGYRHCGEPRLLRYNRRSLMMPPGPTARLRSVPPYLRHFARFLRSEAPMLVHANTLLTLPEALIARASGYPTLLHVHEMLAGGPKAMLTARLARSAHTVLSPSIASQSSLHRAGVTARVLSNGVALAPTVARDGIGRDHLVIGTVGTISRLKGSDAFLAAAQDVRAHRPDVEFRMIGPCASGPERPWAERLVERAREAGVITGVREDIFSELAEWDLFVLPSREDSFPLAVLEAMSVGLPVVATRVGGIPEQVGLDTGVLVEPGDPNSIVAAILMLADQPHMRATMGAAARRRVERDFTLEGQAANLDREYRATLAEACRPRFARRAAATRSREPGFCTPGAPPCASRAGERKAAGAQESWPWM
jgi:glycosyltransferase involved in cell wall biosynthesis